MDRRSRSRSRSRSPSPRGDRREHPRDGHRGRDDVRGGRDARPREKDRDRLERERRERMARLRAENEAEEKGDLAAAGGEGDKDDVAGKGHVSLSGPTATKGKGENNDEGEELDEEQQQMMRMMGFGGFGTTKDKAVADNQTSAAKGAASKNKGRKYRQYMNRKGGQTGQINTASTVSATLQMHLQPLRLPALDDSGRFFADRGAISGLAYSQLLSGIGHDEERSANHQQFAVGCREFQRLFYLECNGRMFVVTFVEFGIGLQNGRNRCCARVGCLDQVKVLWMWNVAQQNVRAALHVLVSRQTRNNSQH